MLSGGGPAVGAAICWRRGRKLTPTRLAPIKSGLADLPLSGGGMTEVLHR
jgi:hypothetical protein